MDYRDILFYSVTIIVFLNAVYLFISGLTRLIDKRIEKKMKDDFSAKLLILILVLSFFVQSCTVTATNAYDSTTYSLDIAATSSHRQIWCIADHPIHLCKDKQLRRLRLHSLVRLRVVV